jgi:SAGA-associated factor 29
MSTRGRSRASAALASASPAPMTDEEQQMDIWKRIKANVKAAEEDEKQAVALVDTIAGVVQLAGSTDGDDLDLDKVAKLQNLYDQEIQLRRNEISGIQTALDSVSVLIGLSQSVGSEASTPAATGPSKKRRRGDDRSGKAPKRGKNAPPADVIAIGRQVAFRLHGKVKGGEEEWIQCEVTKVISEGLRFEVQDPEPDENNNPGQSYKAHIRDIIVIPKEENPTVSYPPGSVVLARYPETTTFYRAEVIDYNRRDGKCRLRFEGEEEEGKETDVERRLVLPLPK